MVYVMEVRVSHFLGHQILPLISSANSKWKCQISTNYPLRIPLSDKLAIWEFLQKCFANFLENINFTKPTLFDSSIRCYLQKDIKCSEIIKKLAHPNTYHYTTIILSLFQSCLDVYWNSYTPARDKMICLKSVRAWVSTVFISNE